MDLDAVLARRPQLVLVDEFAHTNAPGSRHPKRYIDVEELLAAGIDVYSTMNVQHVESLNDIVARITRIRVRETVPDSVVNSADEVELVDITPADLIARLGEGKVYVREQAQRAVKHFFSPGNLTALRELALRRTAERVDDQMLSYMREHAITGPWGAGERVFVCVDPGPDSANTVRSAKRTADGPRCRADRALCRDRTPFAAVGGRGGKAREALRLAEQLGAEIVRVPGRSVVEEILAVARSRNATRVVVGKSRRSRWFELRHGSVVDELVRSGSGLASRWRRRATSRAARADRLAVRRTAHRRAVLRRRPDDGVRHGLGVFIDARVNLSNISLVYVVPVLIAAARHGLVPLALGLRPVGAELQFLLPAAALRIHHLRPVNVVALFFFMFVSVTASALGTRTRAQAQAARREARTTAELYAFSRKIAGVIELDDLLWIVVTHVARLLNAEVAVLMPEKGGPDAGKLELRAAFPPGSEFHQADLAAARWSWDSETPTGRGTDTLPGGRWLFMPIQTSRSSIGVIGVLSLDAAGQLTSSERRLLEAVGSQAAVAIERVVLAADIDQARLGAERERLRSAMLTSVSHDLRTPLASIIGGLSSLKSYRERYDEATRDELLNTALSEAERLDRFVGNLLDMTRLDAGVIVPRREASKSATSSPRRCAAPRRSSRTVSSPRRSSPTCRHCRSTSCWPSRPCSISSTTPSSIRRPAAASRSMCGAPASASRSSCATKGRALPGRPLTGCSRSSTGPMMATGGGLARAWASPSPRASSRSWAGTIRAANRADRSGAEFTVTYPVS